MSNNKELLKKRCRILPAGVWGCPIAIISLNTGGLGD